MARARTFEELVGDGSSVPVEGWDFSWFEGRATEQRPSWGYSALLVERLGRANAVLDVQTGGGEVFAEVLERATRRPGRLAATESWPPNAELARHNLGRFGAEVIEVADQSPLPFEDKSFDLALRKVVWTVPGFTVEKYRDRLLALHEQIGREGPFQAQAERFLIEAVKTG